MMAGSPGRAEVTRARRAWLPSLAVVVVVAVVVGGGYLAASALSVRTGSPVVVGGLVRVAPLSGWGNAGPLSITPTSDRRVVGVRLTRGDGNLDVFAAPFETTAGPADLLRIYLDGVLKGQARQLSVSATTRPVALDSGSAALRASYVGFFPDRAAGAIEGEVTALVAPNGVGVVFDAWGPRDLFQYASAEVDRMIDGSVVL